MNLKITSPEFSKSVFVYIAKWQFPIKKLIQQDLFLLLIACGVCRLFYYSMLVNTDGFWMDSNSYLNYHANVFIGQVDNFRTPLYPYFIKLIKLFGEEDLLRNVKIVQSIISFLTIILFYKIVHAVFKNRSIILITTFIYGITPSIVNFDVCLLTESLSLSAIVIFLYFVLSYLNKPSVYKTVILSLSVFVLIMLRPSFLYLMPLLFVFWFFRLILSKKEWKLNLIGFSASIICVLLIIGYSHLNNIRNKCNSISAVASSNQLENIVNYKMYYYGNDAAITEAITKAIISNTNPVNINGIDGLELLEAFTHSRMTKFLSNCILNQPMVYLRAVFSKIVKLGHGTISVIYAPNKNDLWGVIGFISSFLSITFFNLYLLVFFDFFYIIRYYLKYKQLSWFKFILWLVIIAQFSTVVIGSPGEYNRLFVIAFPCIIIVVFGYVDLLFSFIRKYPFRSKLGYPLNMAGRLVKSL